MATSDRRFRWLVRLLPASFREEHERDMLQVWREEMRDAGRHGQRGVWVGALKDTLRVAPREHASTWVRNIRLAARGFRRAPVFALAAVCTLALGTGAAAGVFSLVNAVLLRPLPWRSAETVGLIWPRQPSGERTWLSMCSLAWYVWF